MSEASILKTKTMHQSNYAIMIVLRILLNLKVFDFLAFIKKCFKYSKKEKNDQSFLDVRRSNYFSKNKKYNISNIS